MDKDDEERLMEFIEKQVERAKQDTKEDENEASNTPFIRSENDAPVVLDFKLKPKPKILPIFSIKQEKTKDENISEEKSIANKSIDEKDNKRKRFDNKETKCMKKIKDNNDPPTTEGWLKEGLTVKVITKSLGDKYYKAKGIVQSVEKDGFVGKVKLKTPEEVNGHVIRLDQEYLETVIPAIGKVVLILWGKHKGKKAIVKKLHVEHYSIDVELNKDKKTVENIPYEQICKYVD
jgi:DNA/RNA-binding protein KIN17